MNKKSLSKRDIGNKFITANLMPVGWDIDSQLREEDGFTRSHATHLLQDVIKKAFAPTAE